MNFRQVDLPSPVRWPHQNKRGRTYARTYVRTYVRGHSFRSCHLCKVHHVCKGYLSSGVPERLDVQTSRRPDVQTSGRPDILTSGRLDVQTSGRPDVGRPDVRTYERPNVRTSGRPDVRTFGRPDVRMSGRPADHWNRPLMLDCSTCTTSNKVFTSKTLFKSPAPQNIPSCRGLY